MPAVRLIVRVAARFGVLAVSLVIDPVPRQAAAAGAIVGALGALLAKCVS